MYAFFNLVCILIYFSGIGTKNCTFISFKSVVRAYFFIRFVDNNFEKKITYFHIKGQKTIVKIIFSKKIQFRY